ncbi:hypothetical protein BDZ94DRAFT_269523 [Collybia nuda]|uniref:Uncharacterized protein n=1 Tax=Collybia nuda TaxID=64659 RepID=A0A9P5YDF2_9AGAR|nr:hypothetical protein BDZ94DRAFT_269523 [Collybia nuda]
MQYFNIVPQVNAAFSGSSSQKGPYPESASSMMVLKRAQRSDGSIMGDIFPLSHLRMLAPLIPRFGKAADPRLTKETNLEYSNEFYLNKYFDKELFYALN